MSRRCRLCLLIRTFFLSALLGGVGGYATAMRFGPGNLSMLVTFFGALLPVLWYVRERRR